MSAAPTKDPILTDHLAWLGYVQPEGLVVSAPALKDAQAVIDRAQLGDLQRRFADHVSDHLLAESDTAEAVAGIADLPRFFTEFLGWSPDLFVGWDVARPLPPELTVSLPEFGETLAPTYAVVQPKPKEGAPPWILLVQVHPATKDLDKPTAASDRNWHASAAKKFERLLRGTGVPIGLLTNGVAFRLIYAPPKENSGALTFPVGAMSEISGRLILGAFHLLLNSFTLFNAPSDARLPALLQRSRDYQASVSEILAEQVLHALYELLRGFEAADGRTQGKLLRELAARNPADIYGGLVTVLLRLVFILFAEDRGLLPASALYVRHYAVRGLFERLRADAERYPDTMDHRFGAWAQLLALFRVVHGGCQHPDLAMPARAGHLFDPDRYPFLEGRSTPDAQLSALHSQLPLLSDGTLHRILEKLCILEGERVSYRTLDVEEIGSVYQTIMGFAVEPAAGLSIALKGKRKNGGVPASQVISLEALLAVPDKDRTKWLKEQADTEFSGEAEKRLKVAASEDDLLVALEKRIDRHATPAPVARGGLVLQPTDERRRSGSHYTPRSFTEPIVRKTLEPILERFGEQPTPAQILDLTICDIAVGSAAFLVETCRQLADVLVRAWRVHGGRPPVPPDETEELLAKRTIAQRCLYGVDRNPMAVDLAKLSLWLATLARDHPFTFLDHAIRCGDSLVGLTAKQIAAFTWGPTAGVQRVLGQDRLEKRIAAATSYRSEILHGGDMVLPALKSQKLRLADEALDEVRRVGDLVIAAFFGADKDNARRDLRDDLLQRYLSTATDVPGRMELMKISAALRGETVSSIKASAPGSHLSSLNSQPAIRPFHWEIEYPEVYAREKPGFDGIVGNPPFAGHVTIAKSSHNALSDWLRDTAPESGGKCDLAAFFFRRAYQLLRLSGVFGLIATNTIAQGDTRESGLTWIRINGGTIFQARKRQRWPGQAAVVVSVIHVAKNIPIYNCELNGKPVRHISAYLFHTGGDESPSRLTANYQLCFQGSVIRGMGFTFDDEGSDSASSLSEMRRLLEKDPRNREIIFPYMAGEELNEDPIQQPRRFVINFGERSSLEAQSWPDLFAIAQLKVLPERISSKAKSSTGRIVEKFWQFGHTAKSLYDTIKGHERVLVCSRVGNAFALIFVPNGRVYSERLTVFAFSKWQGFASLQCRLHETWARFFGSSLKDDLMYTPSDCFETFPFPTGFETNVAVEAAGREYYEFRAELMQDLWLGLTEIYNIFHSPDAEALARLETLYRKRATSSEWRTAEKVPADRTPFAIYPSPAAALKGVHRLRALHSEMDTAVLTAYGWTDLLPRCTCEFLLDYEDDEEGAEESTGRKKKKPWRYRWPDDVRDEVLARLLKLNAERAEQERLAGLACSASKPKTKLPTAPGAKRAKRATPSSGIASADTEPRTPAQGDLFAG